MSMKCGIFVPRLSRAFVASHLPSTDIEFAAFSAFSARFLVPQRVFDARFVEQPALRSSTALFVCLFVSLPLNRFSFWVSKSYLILFCIFG
jgi:hypothetical protein